ncbi:MAG: ATP-binding cassette domain-containing protein, partial [Mycobacteriaceae bacterium]
MSTELDRGATALSNRADLVPPLVVDGLTKRFRVRGRHKSVLTAVDNVSFTIEPGSALGLVGASGSGKTTLASMITGAIRPTSGSITFGEFEVQTLHSRALRRYHRRVQMVFQDPYGALNPLHTVAYTVSRPLQNFLDMTAEQADTRVHELLDTVGLTPPTQYAAKLPHQLSGGQRQRV